MIDCTRKNDAAELRRLGASSAGVRDEFGRGALSYAAEAGTVAAATALLDLGADIRAVDQAGTTPLMIAAEQPNTEMTELLLQHGADARTADAEKRTALFYAARANRAANVRALQQAGALLDVQDSRGYNALDDRAGPASSIRHTRGKSTAVGRRLRWPCRATTRPACSSC